MIVDSGKYYLYRHIRLDKNQPFYIGIGTKNNYNCHSKIYGRAYSKTDRNNLWKKIVSKSKYEVEIILESNDYNFIKQKEKEFINLYGRKDLNIGILSNLTDGGEGSSGKKYSEEERKRISKRMRGNSLALGFKHSDKTKKLVSQIAKERCKDDNWLKSLGDRSSIAIISINNETGELLNHKSVVEASKILNVPKNLITKYLNGKLKYPKGYRFFYKKDHIDGITFKLNIHYDDKVVIT